MKGLGKVFFLFLAGAMVYGIIEILWRGRTHWTMAVLGGICFVICGGVNEYLSWETPLLLQCLICAILITAAELAAGMVLNVRMGLAIWDYSELPFQYQGRSVWATAVCGICFLWQRFCWMTGSDGASLEKRNRSITWLEMLVRCLSFQFLHG